MLDAIPGVELDHADVAVGEERHVPGPVAELGKALGGVDDGGAHAAPVGDGGAGKAEARIGMRLKLLVGVLGVGHRCEGAGVGVDEDGDATLGAVVDKFFVAPHAQGCGGDAQAAVVALHHDAQGVDARRVDGVERGMLCEPFLHHVEHSRREVLVRWIDELEPSGL